MADENKIEIEIVLDDGSVQKGFVNIENKAKQTGSIIKDVFAGNVLSDVFLKGLSLANEILQKSFSAALEAEKAVTSFNAALALSGNYTAEASKKYQDFANELSRTKGISDNLLVSQAAQLAAVTRLNEDGLEKATKSALDLSAALGVSTEQAFGLVEKAVQGNVGALSRYGIKLNEARALTEGASYVTSVLQQRFGGLSDSLNNTFSGAFKRYEEGLNKIYESIGKIVTESKVLKNVLNLFAEGRFALAEKIEEFAQSGVFDEFLQSLVKGIGFLLENVIGPAVYGFELFFKFLERGFYSVLSIYGTFRQLFFEYVVTPVYEFLQPVLKYLGDFGLGIQLVFDTAKEHIENFKNDSITKLNESLNTPVNTTLSDSIKQLGVDLAETGDIADEVSDKLKNNIPQATSVVSSATQAMSLAFEGAKTQAALLNKDAEKNFREVGKNAFTSLGQGVGNAFAAFGKAVAQGKDAVKAFGEALFQAIGQAAIALGTQFILTGLGALAAPLIGKAAGVENPGQLIAAGAALAAFGGALSASGGGGATAPSPSSGGGGVAVASTPESALLTGEQQVATQRGTSIEVNVQGSIFDSDETGLRIADILKDSFAQQGLAVT